MPELPEVEITRRGLLPLVGVPISRVVIRNPALRWPIPDHLVQILPGTSFIELTRRAKYILARCAGGSLLLHLGMSGRICLLAQDEAPDRHDHFDIHFAEGQVMRLRDPRRFGAVLWLQGEPERHPLLQSLGAEPLEQGFDGDWLYAQIRKRTAPIKTVIMDSHLLVGVGNIYASESLFRARIHPALPANQLSRARSDLLAAEIQSTLRDALQAGGSSLRDFFGADGNPGYFQQQYFVYARTGQPCKICAAAIQSMRLGQRSTFFCAHCQR